MNKIVAKEKSQEVYTPTHSVGWGDSDSLSPKLSCLSFENLQMGFWGTLGLPSPQIASILIKINFPL